MAEAAALEAPRRPNRGAHRPNRARRRCAHLALALSESETVRAFARTTIRDHAAVNDAAVLVQGLRMVPQDNTTREALLSGGAETRDRPSALRSTAVDCADAETKPAYHQAVNRTVTEAFLPAVAVPTLEGFHESALETCEVHGAQAGRMVASRDRG